MYSEYIRKRIICLYDEGRKPKGIIDIIRAEGHSVSKSGVTKLLKRYKETGNIKRRRGSGRRSVVSDEILKAIDDQMSIDDETTATQLKKMLADKGHIISLSTILRHRSKLGWTFRGSAYCQMIRAPNKIKRMEWCSEHLDDIRYERLKDVVWTDETSIQLETHRRFCCRKKGQQARPKPR
jgi:transposase